jgi:hypothetical protein
LVKEAAEEINANDDRHQSGSPLVRLVQHLEMDGRILVAGKPNVPNLASLLSFQGRLHAAFVEHPIGVVVVVDFVKLPQIDDVGLEFGSARGIFAGRGPTR